MKTATFRIWRGNSQGGKYQDYTAEVSEGMVVLDAIHQIQAKDANGRTPLDLAKGVTGGRGQAESFPKTVALLESLMAAKGNQH